jgi:SAM-dependent methyltransferase
MSEFWDEMFRKIGSVWTFEPANSALSTSDLFASEKIRNVLIPGIGFGRNAKPFVEKGMDVTGIEISETAIRLARENGLKIPIYHGSVAEMPFDDSVYDGIYCYALIHLLNQIERRQFLKNCSDQLRGEGLMVFITVSKGYTKLYQNGKPISKDRFRIQNGLDVFFYDPETIVKEFGKFGLIEYREIEEPVKHMPNEEPMKFWMVVCRKEPDHCD